MGLYTVLIKGRKMWRRGLDKGKEFGTSRVGVSCERVTRKCVINKCCLVRFIMQPRVVSRVVLLALEWFTWSGRRRHLSKEVYALLLDRKGRAEGCCVQLKTILILKWHVLRWPSRILFSCFPL